MSQTKNWLAAALNPKSVSFCLAPILNPNGFSVPVGWEPPVSVHMCNDSWHGLLTHLPSAAVQVDKSLNDVLSCQLCAGRSHESTMWTMRQLQKALQESLLCKAVPKQPLWHVARRQIASDLCVFSLQ